MKILIVSHTCMTATGQQFYAELEKQTGWDLTILTPASWKDGFGNKLTPPRWHSYEGKFIHIPVWLSGHISLHTYRSFFTKILKETRPDFIYLFQEPYCVVSFQMHLANYLTIRRPIGASAWRTIYRDYPFPFQQMEKWVLQRTDVFFPGTKSVEQVYRKKGYAGPVTYLPFGIDPDTYFPHPDASAIKKKFQAGANKFIIGYVGRIVEYKGFRTLAHALKRIEHLPWRFVSIGAGDYQKDFDQLAEDFEISGRIQHLGYIDGPEIAQYLSAFDALVFPTETRPNVKEQFGRAIIEAMACGVPVVGSNSGEIPFLIEETQGGLIFQEGDSQDLARQLEKMITQDTLRQQLAKVGKQIVLERYTNSVLARRFADTVENTVQKSSNNVLVSSTS